MPAGRPAFTLTVKGNRLRIQLRRLLGHPRHASYHHLRDGRKSANAQITAADIANPATIPVYVLTTGGAYGGGVKSNTMDFRRRQAIERLPCLVRSTRHH